MNIVNKKPFPLVENLDDKANRLIESYTRSSNQRQFLNENGDTTENQIIFNFLGLNETVQNEDTRFTFDNGMYIPGLGAKLSGRLSLNAIFEASKNSDEFVDIVSKSICESKLLFNTTDNDKKVLRESYEKFKTNNSLNS